MKDIKELKLNPERNKYKKSKNQSVLNKEESPETKVYMDWHYRDDDGKIKHIKIEKGNYNTHIDPKRDLIPEIISKKLYKRVENGIEYFAKRYPDDIYCSTENLYVYVPPVHMYGPKYPIDQTPYLSVGYVLIDENTYKSGKLAVLRAVSPMTKKKPIQTDEYMILNLETGKYVLYDAASMIDLASDTKHDSFSYVCVKDIDTLLGYKQSFFDRPTTPDTVIKLNEEGIQMKIDRKWRVYDCDKINKEKNSSSSKR
jgi:hypothetical protein